MGSKNSSFLFHIIVISLQFMKTCYRLSHIIVCQINIINESLNKIIETIFHNFIYNNNNLIERIAYLV